VWGANYKPVGVAHGRAYKAGTDNAVLTVLDGAGHAITVEQPHELAKAVTTFLEKYDRCGGHVTAATTA
jgi:pimeloyl-ACP methyl ester carboxylesterase